MSLRLPQARDAHGRQVHGLLERADKENYKKNEDFEVGNSDQKFIFIGEDSTRYVLTIDAEGSLVISLEDGTEVLKLADQSKVLSEILTAQQQLFGQLERIIQQLAVMSDLYPIYNEPDAN